VVSAYIQELTERCLTSPGWKLKQRFLESPYDKSSLQMMLRWLITDRKTSLNEWT